MACGLCFTVASGVVLFVLCVRALHVLKSTRAYVCLVLQILFGSGGLLLVHVYLTATIP